MIPVFDTLKFERDGAFATITLHRPAAGSAIDVVMARELMT
jgi:2-(1,2-epoxy-1,2-dihydrophenyl)acetyl-CoA isomerase